MERGEASYPWRIWLLCLLTFACFYTPLQNSNVTTRIGLTLSLVERHELTIDPYAPYTIDKAELGGHVYADKAPGLSLLAVPLTAVLAPLLHLPPEIYPLSLGVYDPHYEVLIVVLTLCLVGLLTATAAAVLFRWCRLRGASAAAATFAALTYALGTPVFPWSTIFFGHATAAAFLLIGFALLSNTLSGAQQRVLPPLARAMLAGLVLGVAFVVEFTTGPAVAIVAACCGVEALYRGLPWRRALAIYIMAGVGLAIPMAMLAAYNKAAFGAALHLGYASVQDFPGMHRGFFGISLPQPGKALSLLFGRYRGLLPLSPILLLVPFGLLACLRETRWRALAVASALVFCWYLAMNSGYYYWHGGYSTGPRHLVPALGLLAIPLAALWDRSGPGVRLLSLALLAASVVISLICTAVDVNSPEFVGVPFTRYLLPRFAEGDLPRLLANAFGAPGYLGLIPILAVWAVIGYPMVAKLLRSVPAATRLPNPARV